MHAIADARLVTGELVDVVVDNGVIDKVGPNAAVGVRERIDARGGLILPAFIDTHIHLDKCLTRDRLEDHTGTLASAIGSSHADKAAYTVEDVRTRARSVIESSVLSGTTRLRSHVDVDSIGA